MSEQNKAAVRRWYEEVWNNGNTALIAELMTPDSRVSGIPDPSSVHTGPDAFAAVYTRLQSAFSGLHVAIDEMVAEGETVAVRWTSTGKHTGDTLGFPATGRDAEVKGATFFHFQDGRMLDATTAMDFARMIHQLRSPA